MSQNNFPIDIKILASIEFLEGKNSISEIARKYGIKDKKTIRIWAKKYQVQGASAYISNTNNCYSKEFKTMVVEESLLGKESIENLCIKYCIGSKNTLKHWISLYNSDIELKSYEPKQEVYMADARRKTTFEERKKIVEYCISNEINYKKTAVLFDVSYSQVYSWIKNYNKTGNDGLADKRGHHKADDEVTELERLRRENLRLKRQLNEKDMIVELLKKVKDFERV